MKIITLLVAAVLAVGFATATGTSQVAASPSDRCDHFDRYTVGPDFHFWGGLCDSFEVDLATYIWDFIDGHFKAIDPRATVSHFPCVNPTPLTELFAYHNNDGGLEVNAPRDDAVWYGAGGRVVCAPGDERAVASNPFNVLQDEGVDVLAAWKDYINAQPERVRFYIEPGCNPAADECAVFKDSTRDLVQFEDMACRRYPGAFFCPN